MRPPAARPDSQPAHPGTPRPGEAGRLCPIPASTQRLDALTQDVCTDLKKGGCPLIGCVQEGRSFETLLAEVSGTFVNLPADEVDSQIESTLRRIVEFLGVDRGGLAEVLVEQKRLVTTHSYHLPGGPQLPRILLDEQLPWYARTIQAGEVFRISRLPDELPPDAIHERRYCAQVGLKSHVMIPLKVRDSVVGAIGFGAFRGNREWSDEVVRRLQLVGEIF